MCKEKLRCCIGKGLKHTCGTTMAQETHLLPGVPCFPFGTSHYCDMGRLSRFDGPIGDQAVVRMENYLPRDETT